MKDLITIYTNNHDAAGNPVEKVVSLETWNNLKELKKISDNFVQFALGYTTTINEEVKNRHKELTIKLREAGFDKWDMRTNWTATEYERNNKLESLLK